MASTDRDVLLILYRSTGGTEWDRNTNWCTAVDLAHWDGVEVNEQGRVVKLSLNLNGLRGPIPPELGKLEVLRELDLGCNELSGSIPPELGALSKLEKLWLHGNNLTGLIPPELGKLEVLRELDLGGNELSGSVPPQLGNLTALQELSLCGNQLSGHIPKELGDLGNLETLVLENNQLSGAIPRELGKLTALTGLDLSENGLTGDIPKELGALSMLQQLVLYNNKLTGHIPKELGDLGNLETLMLENNQLSGPIPPELGKLGALRELALGGNELSGPIPPELGDLRELNWLLLNNNQLTGPIPSELANVTALWGIDVRNNQLSGPVPLDDSRQELLRWLQRVNGQIEDVEHAHVARAVNVLTSLWHFCLPVLDDATDLWLLLETFGGSHRGLWWTCLCVFIMADIERVYTAFFFVALLLHVMLYVVTCDIVDFSACISLLGGHYLTVDIPWHLLLDSLLWTLFGSRARSSSFMHVFGLAGDSSGRALQEAGLGLHAIDVMVFFHPFRYFGEFVMSFPRGHRRAEMLDRNEAHRRKMAMVRAVGETLCVDPLFLALSVVTGGWDDNVAGLAVFSALFSVLELVTELQYYVSEADAGNSLSNSAVSDVEVGVGASENPDSRPIELVGPSR